MSVGTTGVFISILFACSRIGPTTSSTFTSSPEPFNNLVQSRLTLSCKTDGGKDVISMVIGRENQKSIAIINSRDGLNMGPNSQNNMEGEGHIEKDSSKTFLSVTIKTPTINDAGFYICQVFFYTPDLEIKEERIRINATFDDQDVMSMLIYLTSRVTDLEKTVHHQTVINIKQEQKILDQDQDLTRQQDEISKQTARVNEKNKKIQNYESTVNALGDITTKLTSTLKTQSDKIHKQEVMLQMQSNKIQTLQRQFDSQKGIIQRQEKELTAQREKIQTQEVTLDNHNSRIQKLERELKVQSENIKEQKRMLDIQNEKMPKQESALRLLTDKLSKQERTVNKQNEKIKSQENTLEQQAGQLSDMGIKFDVKFGKQQSELDNMKNKSKYNLLIVLPSSSTCLPTLCYNSVCINDLVQRNTG